MCTTWKSDTKHLKKIATSITQKMTNSTQKYRCFSVLACRLFNMPLKNSNNNGIQKSSHTYYSKQKTSNVFSSNSARFIEFKRKNTKNGWNSNIKFEPKNLRKDELKLKLKYIYFLLFWCVVSEIWDMGIRMYPSSAVWVLSFRESWLCRHLGGTHYYILPIKHT